MNRWWEPLYDDLLSTMLLDAQSPADLAQTAAFLRHVLELAPGARVFDQCCGLGHLALTLASEGFRVHGVDQAANYVARGRARAREQPGLEVELVVGDAFEHTAQPTCDGAYNWWTSFGYAASDAQNARMLERAYRSLSAGARFALDVPNLPGLLRAFQPTVETRKPWEGGELVLVRHSELDLARGILRKRWRYELPDGRVVEYPSAVRVLAPHELVSTFEAIGFEEIRLFGSTHGESLGLDSPRCIVVGRRP